MTALIGPLSVLALLLFAFWLMVGRTPWHGRNRRVDFTVRPGNIGLVLGALTVSRAAGDFSGKGLVDMRLMFILAGVLVGGLVLFPNVVRGFLGFFGVAAFLVDTALTRGPTAAAWFLVMTIGFVMATAAARLLGGSR